MLHNISTKGRLALHFGTMDRGALLRESGPLVSVHGLLFASVNFIDFASKGYGLLSKIYESNRTIGVQEFLEQVGAIKFGEWRQHPSQCRRLSKAIVNATMVLQSIVGDDRDLQVVLRQKKVSLKWRDQQRQQLMEFVKLKAVERVNLTEDRSEQSASELSASNERADRTATNLHTYKIDGDWKEFSDLPM